MRSPTPGIARCLRGPLRPVRTSTLAKGIPAKTRRKDAKSWRTSLRTSGSKILVFFWGSCFVGRTQPARPSAAHQSQGQKILQRCRARTAQRILRRHRRGFPFLTATSNAGLGGGHTAIYIEYFKRKMAPMCRAIFVSSCFLDRAEVASTSAFVITARRTCRQSCLNWAVRTKRPGKEAIRCRVRAQKKDIQRAKPTIRTTGSGVVRR